MIVEETRTYELDDNIAFTIIKLNRKGYRTTFCCEGHPNGAYISFDRCTSMILDNFLPNNIKLFGKVRYNCPNNWIIDRWENYPDMFYKDFSIRRRFTNEEYLMNNDEQLTNMIITELNEWVDSLPERNSIVEYKILSL